MLNKPRKNRIILMGTPEFSVPIFELLLKNYEILAVVTQPDKKVGRKQELTFSAVKKFALVNNLPVLQPAKVKDNQAFLSEIEKLHSDLIIVVAYGFLLPQQLLDIPKHGVINVHASLLPKLRGASPIQTAILKGEKETGVTIMLINDKMDEGDILSQAKTDISNQDTFATLHDKLAELGANLLSQNLPGYLSGQIKPQPQDNSQATYCQLITKDMGKIDWSKSAIEIDRQIRAFTPWPGSFTFWQDKQLKINKAKVIQDKDITPGKVVRKEDSIIINCGQNSLEIIELQSAGKKAMSAREFLNGYPNIIDVIFK